jgi:hypothetical protein
MTMREYDIITREGWAGIVRAGIIAVGTGTVLAGCSTLSQAPAVDPLVACTSYKAVLGTVNDVLASGELTDERVVAIGGRVEQSNTVVLPLCTGDMPDTNSAAAQRILTGLSALVAIQTEIQ